MLRKGFLIGFVGSPYSGKTTTAALLFGELKKIGVQVEYMPEYARDRIRELKSLTLFKNGIDKETQAFIRDRQEALEHMHLEFNGEGAITITDGSTANSYFYGGSKSDLYSEISRYDLLFFSRNIDTRSYFDENRIHNEKFSLDMEAEILNHLREVNSATLKVIELDGNIDKRLAKALTSIAELVKETRTQ
jgi:thymidylate kinase